MTRPARPGSPQRTAPKPTKAGCRSPQPFRARTQKTRPWVPRCLQDLSRRSRRKGRLQPRARLRARLAFHNANYSREFRRMPFTELAVSEATFCLGIRKQDDGAMTEGTDRRRHNRRQSTYRARAVFNDQSPTLPCTVQNLSASGAQLTFAAAVALPPSFVLEIPSLDLQVEARVVWSCAGQHGVTLVWPQRTPWA